MRKELAGNPYSSMALAKEAAEAVRPWPYQHLRPIIMGMTFCGCAHEHPQCATWVTEYVAAILLQTGRSSWGRYILQAWP